MTKWGTYGSGDGQFSGPWGIATDSSDNVYVTEYENHRIQKFSSSGSFIAKWGSFGSEDGQFNHPTGIAVDSSDNVYVADSQNHRIQKFSSSGSFITKWGSDGMEEDSLVGPNGIATDSSSNVYVADTYSERIVKFSSSGGFIAAWGSGLGFLDGRFFNYPIGIATDSWDNVYISDSSQRVQKFSSSGTSIANWGSAGSGDGQFSQPSGIAIDSFGNVYVNDSARIQKFSSSGSFITKWGSIGSGDGQFSQPLSIAADSLGNVYVADLGNNRIQKFSSTPETTITGGPAEGATTADDQKLTFDFVSDTPGSTFECKIDEGPFTSCTTPLTLTPIADTSMPDEGVSASRARHDASASRVYQGGSQPADLEPGPHSIHVRAKDPMGKVDPTPATRTFLTSSICHPRSTSPLTDLIKHDLAKCYAPYLVFDSHEEYWPLSIDSFIQHSNLYFAHDNACRDHQIARSPAPARLGYSAGQQHDYHARQTGISSLHPCHHSGHKYGTTEFTRPNDESADRQGLDHDEGFYLNLVNSLRRGTSDFNQVPVYYQIQLSPGPGSVWIRYYFMYGWSGPPGGGDTIEGKKCCHEGEWEGITILLDKDPQGNLQPDRAFYYQHHGGQLADWSDMRKHGLHPNVYVAQTAHASYLEPGPRGGHHEQAKQCAPLGLSNPICKRDISDGAGRGWKVWSTRLKNTSAAPWYGYGGAWGHAGRITDFTGPLGPSSYADPSVWSSDPPSYPDHYERWP